ncbi:tetratricopeptide repeat-containing sensor histidine kinase [Ancylomarina longa]|uniref:histidine kinase n=1 Tax=Ancylomarina longa TaxID=2487017 RepID=A0A434AWC3_9BACT|nr:ATP-binding protein [Ancylomarina longa]RUT78811.1 hypothetical protein DLK05_06680 [Ancylomarina longa]
MKKNLPILFLIVSLCFCQSAFGEFQNRLDSLNNRYGKVYGREKLETLLEISREYWNIEPNKGVELGSQALALAQNLDYSKQVVKALYYLGTAYYYNNQYDNALDYLLQAHRFASNHDYKKYLADISIQLATVYYQSGKLKKSYDYTITALDIYESQGDSCGVANCQNLLGIYYMGIHEYDRAIDYFQNGLKLGKELSKKSIIGSILNDLGSLYTVMGDTLKAIRTYKEAVKYQKSSVPNYKSGEFELNLGHLYILHGELARAKMYLSQGLRTAKALKSKRLLRDYYKYMALFYTKNEEDHNSVIAYQTQQAYQDSLAADQLANKIEDLDSRHAIEVKNQENQELRAENQTQQLEITRQYIVGLLILLVLLVAIFLLTFRYRNNLKDNELLYLRNRLVSQHQEELISAMKRLKNSEDKLRKANETKDKMFSLIAHDLRGAIGNISNGLRMYLGDEDLNLSEEDKKEFLQALFHSSDNAYELLENLLFWAKNQTKSITANKQMVDASSIINSNIGLLGDLAKIKSIKLFTSSNPSVEVFVDWNMINTVLRNLISNAIKFTNKDGSIEINSQIGEYFVKISVKDDGIGMMPEQIENIFDGKTTDGTANEKGTGLGLTLCRDFLIKNKGKLYVESTVDKGSTFSFIIPRRPMSQAKFEELLHKESSISLVNS